MSKVVFLIVTDLHLYCVNKNNRINYAKESLDGFKHVENLAMKYSEMGYAVNIIFLGDIFDRGYSNTVKGIAHNNRFIRLSMVCENMYSVVGNHELTYYKDNPFWTLFRTMESKRVSDIVARNVTPTGEFNILEVVDQVTYGNVRFYFNHYGLPVLRPTNEEGMINIGLFHQDITSKEIVEFTKQEGREFYEVHSNYFDETDAFDDYQYAMLGHMHSIYGVWNFLNEATDKQTTIYNLASIGRTNHREVRDDFLTRIIPAVIIEDEKFKKIVEEKIALCSRKESVNEETLKQQTTARELKKEIDYIKGTLIDTGDCITNVKEAIGNEVISEVIDCILSDRVDPIYKEILNRLDYI